jgi:hypothetical protein
MVLTKSEMLSYFFQNPINKTVEKKIFNSTLKYFEFDADLIIKTKKDEVLNGCLLSGNNKIIYNEKDFTFNRFDFFFIPPDKKIIIKVKTGDNNPQILCLVSYSGVDNIEADFEIQQFNLDKFLPRGEPSSENKMATFRTVWTAIKNGYFMSGFTNIPNQSLKQGVITSVNLEEDDGGIKEIYSHIHPDYPEVYIMCIDDQNYAITQYLINEKGQSVCMDLQDGDGLFFPGNLGHSNFARPFYKNLKYCMYMWIIPTFHNADSINPITLKV